MNGEYSNDIKKNILTQSFFCRLTICLIILFIACGCAGKKPSIITAAGSGDTNTVKRLQAEGGNINEADGNGATALMYAIWSKKPDVAKYLIECGADIKAKDSNDFDALIYAVDYKQFELINILIDKGADIESRDYLGNTPLAHAAFQIVNIDAVKMLIKRGADVNTRNNASELLLDLVLDLYNRMDIVAELVNAGAKLLEPTKGQARIFFIAEGAFWGDTVRVSIEKHSKDLKKDTIAFIDVTPGNHTVIVQIARWLEQPKVLVDAKAGQTYYFKVSPSKAHYATRIISTGVFEIAPLEESVAKGKIKTLLKTIQ